MTERTKDIADLKLYTLTELEPILGVSHRTLLRYMKDGSLKASKIGAKWRVTREALEEFINGTQPNKETSGPAQEQA